MRIQKIPSHSKENRKLSHQYYRKLLTNDLFNSSVKNVRCRIVTFDANGILFSFCPETKNSTCFTVVLSNVKADLNLLVIEVTLYWTTKIKIESKKAISFKRHFNTFPGIYFK